MYRQVKIAKRQWNLQRIFWRENWSDRLKEYHLVVVTYGLSSSPYVTVRAMIEGAEQYVEQFPKAVDAFKKDFYMDDGATGDETEEKAIQLAKNMKYVLSKSQFDLCKWRSNSKKLVHEHHGEANSDVDLFESENAETSVLGLKWLTGTDEFTYSVKAENVDKWTKRVILSKIGQLFDPAGFCAPVITRAKIIMQRIWKLELEWDDIVPQEIVNDWKTIWDPIKLLERMRIPRWVQTTSDVQLQIHGFSDACFQAYGAAV